MRYLIFVPVLALSVLALATLATGAQAKGPFSLVIKGGDLREPITIDGPLTIEKLLQNPDAYPIRLDPPPAPEFTYTLAFYSLESEEGPAGRDMGSLTYFPEGDGHPALLRNDEGLFMPVHPEFQSFLDVRIAAARGDASSQAADSDATSALWYIAPGLALGLVLVGGGLAGRRLFLRRDV